MNAREFKMTYGKYKGETLEKIYINDVGYLEWLLDKSKNQLTPTLSQVPAKIEECFKEMRTVRIFK